MSDVQLSPTTGDVTRPWIAPVADPRTPEQRQYRRGILEDVTAFRLRTHSAAKRRARDAILRIVGSVTERFAAKSTWLFLKTSDSPCPDEPWIKHDCTLAMEFRHNTQSLPHEATRTTPGIGPEHGITGYVAATWRPYLCNEIHAPKHQDPYYRHIGKRSNSELAVPILMEDSDGIEQLLGVLNLESDRSNAFLDAYKGELQAAATELAPHILIWYYLREHPHGFGWHPEVHGWTLDRLLEEFCAAVAGSDDTTHEFERIGLLPRPSCTIWSYDHDADPKRKLHVRATARFDYEYSFQRRLPRESFTGQVAELQCGMVGRGTPDELRSPSGANEFDKNHPFHRGDKAANMGMAYSVSHPIYCSDSKPTAGALNLYFFQEELNNFFPQHSKQNDFDAKKFDELFPTRLACELAESVGELMEGCESLRAEVAAAFLQFRLSEHALSMVTDFNVIKEVMLKCLDAKWCSIFARDDSSASVGEAAEQLQCVATTGLMNYDGTPLSNEPAVYEPEDAGLTTALVDHPDKCIRLDSVSVQKTVTFFRSQIIPSNKFRESFSLGVSEHRPYLGICVGDRQTGHPLGVIRCGRRYQSPPFIEADEHVLRRLALGSRAVFLAWKRKPLKESAAKKELITKDFPKRKHLGQQPASAALTRLTSALTTDALWNRRHVDGVLLDLINVFASPSNSRAGVEEPLGGFIANLRLALPWSEKAIDELHIYATHSRRSIGLPDEDTLRRHREHDNIGKHVLGRMCPVTFDANNCSKYMPILDDSEHVRTGVSVPVRSVSRNGIVKGVLSVDTDIPSLNNWTELDVAVMACAAKKLDFLGRDNRLPREPTPFGRDWKEACQTFLRQTVKRAILGTDVERISRSSKPLVQLCDVFYVVSADRSVSLNLTGIGGPSQNVLDKLSFRSPPLFKEEAREHDVLVDLADGAFSIPLWYGPYPTPLVMRGRLAQEWDSDLCEVIRHQKLCRKTAPPPWNKKEALDDRKEELMRSIVADLIHMWNLFIAGEVDSGRPFCDVRFRGKPIKDGMVEWKPTVKLCAEIEKVISSVERGGRQNSKSQKQVARRVPRNRSGTPGTHPSASFQKRSIRTQDREFELDTKQKKITFGPKAIHLQAGELTPTQWAILGVLWKDHPNVVSDKAVFRTFSSREFNSYRQSSDRRLLERHISDLRKHLRTLDPESSHDWIVRSGDGYKLSIPKRA